MHLLLTDILTCPACGPGHGLIVRTDSMRDRRIIEGAFGCPSCEQAFPVRGGVAFMDPAIQSIVQDDDVAADNGSDPTPAIRIAALLGLRDVDGFALIAGPAARFAGAVSDLTERIEIVADASRAGPGGFSRMTIGARLPFYDGRLRGIWLSGGSADVLLEEAVRALHPLGRLVLDPAPSDAGARLAAAGMSIEATQDGTVLARKVP